MGGGAELRRVFFFFCLFLRELSVLYFASKHPRTCARGPAGSYEVSEEGKPSGGRSTPIRSQWITRETKRANVGGAVAAADNFLKSKVARDLGGGSEASTDASFGARLNDLVDPSLESNITMRTSNKSRDTSETDTQSYRSRPPLSGWIGDYSSDVLGGVGHKRLQPSVWDKPSSSSRLPPSANNSNATSIDDLQQQGGQWDFSNIVNKEASSGSDLNLSKSASSGIGEGNTISSKLSNVESQSGSGSSVASSEIYTRDALAAASPGSPDDASLTAARTPSLSPDSPDSEVAFNLKAK